MTKPVFSVILLLLLSALVACTSPAPESSNDVLAPLPDTVKTNDESLPTLLELLSEDPNLIFFINGLNRAGLADDLESGDPFTVFAPSNISFSNAGLIVSQMDPALIGSIMDNHLARGSFSEAALLAAGSVITLTGEQLAITQDSETLKVSYAPLAVEARPASNGTLFVIDILLLPPETGPEKSMWGVLQADGRFTTFISILEGTHMMEELRFGERYDAIFAPTDDAFAKMPTSLANWLQENPFALQFIASFHLLDPEGWPQDTDLTMAGLVELEQVQTRALLVESGTEREELNVSQTGDSLKIGEAVIVDGDIDATNGVVHAIDTVLIPQILQEDLP